MHAWQILQVRDGDNLKQAGRKMWNERRWARKEEFYKDLFRDVDWKKTKNAG